MMVRLNHTKAVLFGVFAALSISLMSLCVKLAVPYTTSSLIVSFRFGISLFYIVIVLKFKNKPHFFPKTQYLHMHLIRSFSAVMSMMLLYYALTKISLVNANILFMTNALFTPIFAWLCFKTKTNKKSWLSILFAFIGVALVLKPNADLLYSHGSIFGLLSGILGAVSILSIRQIVKHDSPHTIMAYYFPIAFLVSSLFVVFNWHAPSITGIVLMCVIGLTGIFYQECLIRASQYAPARTVSTLLYLSIIFSGLLDWFIWHHSLDMWSWIGIIFVLTGSAALMMYTKTGAVKQTSTSSRTCQD
jgi:drug/metabolite transporter (DMT)-like permease